jgi:two-component system sensor histidine kinase/response regulator
MTNLNKRLLIVDDEQRNLRLLEGMLYAEPYELVLARSGVEALEIVRDNPPDLILLDVMMPGMSGFEVCKRIKSDPELRMIPIVMVTALSDVSDRIEAMQAGADDFLSKPIDAAELIVRVRSLVRIRQLYVDVERITKHKLQVMAGIAHNIRSPLNALSLSLEQLAEKIPNDERLAPWWANITTCIDHIRMLSTDLMHYYQMESGQFNLTYSQIPLPHLIDSVMQVVTPIAAEKNIQLSLETVPDTKLTMDESAISQVLLNLLTNAIKYTERGGSVKLCVHDLASSGYNLPLDHYPPVLALPSTGIVAEITDTGRGISPQDFGRIFLEFDRLNASENDMEGVGLGLAVSQRLVRLHGGEIWFTSRVGQGSTFAFFLPIEHDARSVLGSE